MRLIFFFIISFFIISLFYNFFVFRKEKAMKKMKSSKEVILFCKINKININKINLDRLIRLLGFTNAFIVSLVGTFVLLINNFISNFYIWILVSSFLTIIVLIPVIILIYRLVGLRLKKESR